MSVGRIINCMQGDAAWLHERTGRVTASRMADVMSRLKNGQSSAAREKYKMELLTEILTGRAAEHYVSPAMDFGIENEGLARTCYELKNGIEVERVGMFVHPRIERFSASPDALVGEFGLLEIKCPNTTTHLNYLLADVVPEEYKPQMNAQMSCTGRSWVDYCSYDPRLPSEYGLFIVRFERDDKAIAEMEAEVEKFIIELAALINKLPKAEVGQQPPRAHIPEMV